MEQPPPPPRFPDCHHYHTCLTAAALVDAYGLGCGRCDRYRPAEPSLTGVELRGILALVAHILGCAPDALHDPRPWREFDPYLPMDQTEIV